MAMLSVLDSLGREFDDVVFLGFLVRGWWWCGGDRRGGVGRAGATRVPRSMRR